MVNTRYTKQRILNAGGTTNTCHLRDVILTPASPLGAAAAHWQVRREGSTINYMIHDFSRVSLHRLFTTLNHRRGNYLRRQ